MEISNRTLSKDLEINYLRVNSCGVGKMGQDIHQISSISPYNVSRMWPFLPGS